MKKPQKTSPANLPPEEEFAETLAQMRALDGVPPRDPERVADGRQAFLNEARDLEPAVSSQGKIRHMGWTNIFKKERSPMFRLARILLITAIALGASGATAYAAQESLPNQALYPVKTWIEDVRLGLASSPQTDFDLLMGFVDERIDEIEGLIDAGLPVKNEVQTRLQAQWQQALQIAAEMDDAELLKAMEQVQIRTREQVQLLENMEANRPEDIEALQLTTRAMNNIRNTAEDAIEDPLSFRLRQGTNRPEEAGEYPDNQGPYGEEDTPGSGPGQGPQGSGKGDGNGTE
jgi:hypothetical protein